MKIDLPRVAATIPLLLPLLLLVRACGCPQSETRELRSLATKCMGMACCGGPLLPRLARG